MRMNYRKIPKSLRTNVHSISKKTRCLQNLGQIHFGDLLAFIIFGNI